MFYLQRNLPRWERLLRLALAALIAVAAIASEHSGVVPWLAGAAAVALALTGVVGSCPACAMFGRRPVGRSS